jgi:prepilin signal peptidase PulO-like enzyme (type II secretory pathway)
MANTAPQATQTNEQEAPLFYNIPLRYRKMENLHIVFWLFKDVAWCMGWRPLGIVMIIPTLLISIIIAWRTRQYMSELCHNIAISLWISANSYWMVSEFLHFDTKVVFGEFTFKHLALVPFVLGLITLGYYYLYWKHTHKNDLETM